jgi:hypothetical protein
LKTKYSKASGTGGRKKPKTLSGIETFAEKALFQKVGMKSLPEKTYFPI